MKISKKFDPGGKVGFIDTFIHSYERFYGQATTATGAIKASLVTTTAFRLDAGNVAYGSWVQLFGSGDTPAISGKTQFRLSRIVLPVVENANVTTRLQFAFGGPSGVTAFSTGEYTDVLLKPADATDQLPISVADKRHSVGVTVWGRAYVKGTNTSTVDVFVSTKEY